MLLFYKVMATVDWKKLEGRIFRFDVNTSTADALKATNPAIIHFTTEGNIVMNGEKFCSPKKKDLKVVKLYTTNKFAKYDAVLTHLNGEELQYLNYPEEATEDNYKSYMIVASLIDGKPFYWFGNAFNYDGILERIASEKIIGVDEKTFNAGFDSLANDIVFAFDYDMIEVKSHTSSTGSDGGDLTIVSLFNTGQLCIITMADNEAGGIYFGAYPGSELKSAYSDISLLPINTGCVTFTASKKTTGVVKIGKGLTTHSDNSDTGDYIDEESVGLLELLPAKADTLGGVKKANLNLQSEYEFLKAVPSVTTLDEAKFAINHLRIICKTLVDKLEEAGTLNH